MDIKRRIRQSDGLSVARYGIKGTIVEKSAQVMAYEDDITIAREEEV